MDEQQDQNETTTKSEDTSSGGLDGRHLRGGLTAFVVLSLCGLATIRAVDYYSRTHGPGAVPVTVSDTLSEYAPAVVMYAVAIAALVYVAIMWRRASSSTNRS